jgi:hypothetical protein
MKWHVHELLQSRGATLPAALAKFSGRTTIAQLSSSNLLVQE